MEEVMIAVEIEIEIETDKQYRILHYLVESVNEKNISECLSWAYNFIKEGQIVSKIRAIKHKSPFSQLIVFWDVWEGMQLQKWIA